MFEISSGVILLEYCDLLCHIMSKKSVFWSKNEDDFFWLDLSLILCFHCIPCVRIVWKQFLKCLQCYKIQHKFLIILFYICLFFKDSVYFYVGISTASVLERKRNWNILHKLALAEYWSNSILQMCFWNLITFPIYLCDCILYQSHFM